MKKKNGSRRNNETLIESRHVYLCWLLIDGAISSMTNSLKIFKQRFEFVFQIRAIEFKFELIFYLHVRTKLLNNVSNFSNKLIESVYIHSIYRS